MLSQDVTYFAAISLIATIAGIVNFQMRRKETSLTKKYHQDGFGVATGLVAGVASLITLIKVMNHGLDLVEFILFTHFLFSFVVALLFYIWEKSDYKAMVTLNHLKEIEAPPNPLP